MGQIRYNERAWAMDLASEANIFINNHLLLISRVSGEGGLRVGQSTLFPDLLIHDNEDNIILGVELKFPDTQPDDNELIINMCAKAASLGLNHGLSWNGQKAILWKIEQQGKVTPLRTWMLDQRISRKDFDSKKEATFEMMRIIMRDLEDFFNSNHFRSIRILDAITGQIILRFVHLNRNEVASRIKRSVSRSIPLRRELLQWWHSNSGNWPSDYKMEKAKAESILFSWVSRLVSAHLICSEPKHVKLLSQLNNIELDWQEYKIYFNNLGEISKLNLLFKVNIFDTIIGNVVLNDIHELNMHLGSAVRYGIESETIQDLYNKLMSRGLRKSIGQFSTPSPLARLLLAHSLPDDLNKVIGFIDPCCGKGTLPFEAVKMADGMFDISAIASDKFRLPIMLTMLRFLQLKNEKIDIFETDLFAFGRDEEIESAINQNFINANSQFDWLCFNPPFVRQEHVNFALAPYASKSSFSSSISRRTDLAGYAILHAAKLVKSGGKFAFIAPNSILNTDWGADIIQELRTNFHINKIIRSVDEKWFSFDDDSPAELVCVALVLTKRNHAAPQDDEQTEFVTQLSSLRQIHDAVSNEQLINGALESSLTIKNNLFQSTILQWGAIEHYRYLGIGMNSMFESDFEQLIELIESLTPIDELLEISRGERRGWNPLFYPKSDECEIEDDYIRPLIKTPKEVSGLIAQPASIAFCCSLEKERLRDMAHIGALNWIESFEEERNGKGELLPEVLQRSGLKWYEIADSSFTDFVMMMNAGQRHLVAYCPQPSIVDQRLIRMNAKEILDGDHDLDVKCLHAILNSSLNYLYFETIGFGRGLGALDLNPTLIKKYLRVFNPNLLDKEQKRQLVSSFAPLLERDVYPILEEINMPDRIQFENLLMSLYGVADKANVVRSLLSRLVNNRLNTAGR